MLKIRGLRVIANFSLIGMLFILSGCGSTSASWVLSFQPAFLPLHFSVDANGTISIQGDVAIETPIGTFAISANASDQLKPADNELLLIIRHNENNSIVDTAYNIQTGQSEVTVVTNGTTTIDVTQHKVFIDASMGTIQTIEIKSGNSGGYSANYKGTWSNSQPVGQNSSGYAPALITWNNKLYMAFVDSNNNNELTIVSSTDGINWTNNLTFGQASNQAPALVVWNNALYMAFTAGPYGALFLVSSTDGRIWSAPQNTGEFSNTAPALGVLNNTLYMAFVATDTSSQLLVTSSTDGSNWSTNILINDATSNQAPALNTWNGTLYMAYNDANHNNNLAVVSSADGKNWTGSEYIKQASNHAPALVIWNNILCMIFTANDSSNELLLVFSKDGGSWTDNQVMGQASNYSPALATLNGILYIAFTANGSNELLLVSSSGV